MSTRRQKQVLKFIKNFVKKNDYAPSLEEIKKHLRLSSVSTAHYHVKALENLGFLRKENNQPRAIDVYEEEQMSQVPFLGIIAAGQPILAFEEKETIAIPTSKLSRNGNFFALRVSGKSMIDENIDNDDVVIIRSQPIANNGQRIVALINNEEVTLKKFYKEKNRIRLQPSNPAMDPIYLDPKNLLIQGIVVDIIKKPSQPLIKKTAFATLPKAKRPKGGCELSYQEKISEKEIIINTKPAEIKLIKKYGSNRKNKLILGDNLSVLRTLYNDPKVRGNVNLIYIDPPFGTGQDFVGYNKKNSYSDKLINAEFLEFLRKRIVFLRELLAKQGSIYLHIDLKIGHYVKVLMDEIFGEDNFRNDITRIKCNPKNFERKAYGNVKDVIYFYSKSKPNNEDYMYWSDYRSMLSPEEIKRQFPKINEFGQRYATTPLHAKGETKNGPTGQPWKNLRPPKGRHWRYDPKKLTRLDKEGLIEWSSTGNPRKIIFAHENAGKKIQDIWDFKDPGFEKSIYPTEKNEEMLKQIILASSKKGDLVLDCFCGSGTTLVAAEKLGRNWIGVDSNETAINVAKSRLLKLDEKANLFSQPVSFSTLKAS